MSAGSGRRTAAGRLAVAVAVSSAVVLSAPFLGQLRGWLRATFPGHYVAIVGGAVALAVMAGLAAAVVRIRHHRLTRLGVIASAVAVALLYATVTRTGIPEVDAVERVHFVEYGIVAWLFYIAWRPLRDLSSLALPIMAALIVGTLDEWLQWFIPNRVGEARDVLLNLVAIICGLSFGAALDPPDAVRLSLGRGSRTLMGTVGAATVLVFAAFVHVVHLGHVIATPGIGEFRSRYTHDVLLRLAADRAERWRRDPPLELKRLSREDQYLDEGLWHVRERNRQWTNGSHTAAWHENLILEAYFEPVLDTKTYAAPDLHRWPPEQRADAQQRASARPEDAYVSAAEPFPIVAWSRSIFWSITAAAVTALLAFAFWPAGVPSDRHRARAPDPPGAA